MSTWSESDEDSREEECTSKVANICFLALEDHKDDMISNPNYNKL